MVPNPQQKSFKLADIISPNFITGLGISLGLAATFATRSFSTYLLVLGGILVACFMLPKYCLLPFALIIYSVTPVAYIAEMQQIRSLSPIFVVALVVVLRNLQHYKPARLIFLMLMLIGFLYLSTMSIMTQRSFGWSQNFILAIALLWQPRLDSEKTWTLTFNVAKRLTYIFTIIGVIEFSIKATPIIGHFGLPEYRNLLWNTDRSWSIYRITTTLGHPLNNGLFFCTLALIMIVYTYKRQAMLKSLAPIALSVLLLVLSGSRNSMLAFGIGIIILILTKTDLRNHKRFKRYRNILLLVLFGSILIQPVLSYIGQRNNSTEGSTSFTYRFRLLTEIQDIIPSVPRFGFGPGTSSQAFALLGENTILENGIAQLAISLGVIVATLIVGSFLFFAIKFLVKNPGFFVPAIPTITIILSTNFLDDNFPFLVFLGLSFSICLFGAEASEQAIIEEGFPGTNSDEVSSTSTVNA